MHLMDMFIKGLGVVGGMFGLAIVAAVILLLWASGIAMRNSEDYE